jgi:hypothetical protein
MTKNLQSDSLGDRKSATLRPQEVTLRARVDQPEFLVAQASSAVKKSSASAGLVAAGRGNDQTAPTSCHPRPWLSFFFE